MTVPTDEELDHLAATAAKPAPFVPDVAELLEAVPGLIAAARERNALRRANDAYTYLGADGKAVTGRALEDRLAAAEASNDALRKALEPFDDALGEDEPHLPDNEQVVIAFGPHADFSLTLGDLRRARTTLKENTNG